MDCIIQELTNEAQELTWLGMQKIVDKSLIFNSNYDRKS
jgi:hypothetical protein